MFTTLIVDDEERALSGIRRTFPWDGYGFIVMCATTDPTAALDYLRTHQIDLALVDIRMPELSGLDIVRISREEELVTEFVIVSGHSEFEFARDALQQGVLDYCLKPIREEAAASVLARAAKHLRRTRENRRAGRTAGQLLDLYTLRKYFNEPLPFYCVAVAVEDLTKGGPPGSAAPEFAPITKFFQSGSHESIYVFNHKETDPRGLLVTNPGAWRLGFGTVCSNIEAASVSLEEAREALTASSFYPDEKVFLFAPVKEAIVTELTSNLVDALATGMIFLAEEFFNDLPAAMRSNHLMPWDARRLHASVVNAIIGRQRSAAEADGQQTTLKGFCEKLRSLALGTICPEARKVFAVGGANSRMRSMLAHVHRNIGVRLTLRELSGIFYFHPNYGCELFRQYTGMRFSEYMIRMKLWHARHLLAQTNKPIAVVAEDVGYDYYHFSKLFKKYEGVTPKSYRASHAV